MDDYILVNKVDNRVVIQINRPAQKNALNIAMYAAMAKGIQDAVQDENVRVICIKGLEGCFTSGNDMNDFAKLTDVKSESNSLLDFMHKLAACPKVVVAEVDGLAIGIGTTLLLHCDFVYASSQARFQLPFVRLGLCPEYASSLLLPKVVGMRKAVEYLMLGEAVSAEQACQVGLINDVVDDVKHKVEQVCQQLAAQAPQALMQTKALMKSSSQLQVEEVIEEEADVFTALIQGPEFAEAAAAFFEKRTADFSKL